MLFIGAKVVLLFGSLPPISSLLQPNLHCCCTRTEWHERARIIAFYSFFQSIMGQNVSN